MTQSITNMISFVENNQNSASAHTANTRSSLKVEVEQPSFIDPHFCNDFRSHQVNVDEIIIT